MNYETFIANLDNINNCLQLTGQEFRFKVTKNKWRKYNLYAVFTSGKDIGQIVKGERNLSRKAILVEIAEIINTNWKQYEQA